MKKHRGIEFGPQGNETRQALEEWQKQFPYTFEVVGENPQTIILGEDHNREEIISSQASLITAIKPGIILYEPLHAWQYNPNTKKLELIPERKISKNEDYYFEIGDQSSTPKPQLEGPSDLLLKAADKAHSWIIGCDLTYAEFKDVEKEVAEKDPKNYRYEGRLIKKRRPDEIINYYFPEINPFRDKLMANMILKHQKTSSRPLMAILGWKHAVRIKKSAILENAGLSYAVVKQDRVQKTNA